MTDPTTPPDPILFATDLSARSDRALDRAARLARQWNSELIVAHVVPPSAETLLDEPGPSDALPQRSRLDQARHRLERDIGEGMTGVRLIVASGDVPDVILDIAARERCGLIVTGVARDETLGRMLLGTTVDRLVRNSTVPVLVVKQRAGRAYREMLVPVDLSEASACALIQAIRLFPDCDPTVLHVDDTPYAGTQDPATRASHRRQIERRAVPALLDRVGFDAPLRARTKIVVEEGNAVLRARDYVTGHEPDLTVIASHGRSALYEIAIGSTATALLRSLPTDILLVRHPEAVK